MSKKNRDKRKRSNRKPIPPVPDPLFKSLADRIEKLKVRWVQKWPDGVNPEKCVHPMARAIGPAARAYNAGVRERSLYDQLEAIERFLDVPMGGNNAGHPLS